MRILTVLLICVFLFAADLCAQEKTTGSFQLEGLSEKSYAVYVPTQYDAGKANGMILVLHPRNTARWTAAAWRDTLTAFAEANQLLMVAPDGGPDGSVADPDDELFQRALIDSMKTWYNVDDKRIYVFGFSFGGRAAYTFGLQHPDVFAGYLILGPAIQLSEVSVQLRGNAFGKPFYLINGSQDAPNIRFTPFVDMLEEEGAIVNSLLLQGVPHTIDFNNRNQILSDAFQWLDTVGRTTTDVAEQPRTAGRNLRLFPNSVDRAALPNLTLEVRPTVTIPGSLGGSAATFNLPDSYRMGPQPVRVEIVSAAGALVWTSTLGPDGTIGIPSLAAGRYFVRMHFADGPEDADLIIQ